MFCATFLICLVAMNHKAERWFLYIAGIVTVIVGYIKLRPTVIRTRAWTPAQEVSILFCVHIKNYYVD